MGRRKGGKNPAGHRAGGRRKGAGRPRKSLTVISNDFYSTAIISMASHHNQMGNPATSAAPPTSSSDLRHYLSHASSYDSMASNRPSSLQHICTDFTPMNSNGVPACCSVPDVRSLPYIPPPQQAPIYFTPWPNSIPPYSPVSSPGNGSPSSTTSTTQPRTPALSPAETNSAGAYFDSSPSPTFPPSPMRDPSVSPTMAIDITKPAQYKRRRRRCLVCVDAGKPDGAFDCPGRGDRSRCLSIMPPSSGKAGLPRPYSTEAMTSIRAPPLELSSIADSMRPPIHSSSAPLPGNVHGLFRPPMLQSPLDYPSYPQPNMSSVRSYPQPFSYSPPMDVPKRSVTYPPPAPFPQSAPVTSSTASAEIYILPSGQASKRRGRRCMVCVSVGREGTSCAGRGNRLLCPHYPRGGPLPGLPELRRSTQKTATVA